MCQHPRATQIDCLGDADRGVGLLIVKSNEREPQSRTDLLTKPD
jgi:hypothetical protein